MLGSRAVLLCIVAVALAAASAQAYDETRVKAVAAEFLETDPALINCLRIDTLETGMGPPPIVVDLPDPPDSRKQGAERGIHLEVASRGLYVHSAIWLHNRPPDRPKCPNQLSLDCTQEVAEKLARRALAPWPPGMRLGYRQAEYRGQENPIHDFQWEEWNGIARTGTRVSVGVNPCPPGAVYRFYMYLAPKHSASEVKITREQAIAAATESLRQKGAVNPKVWKDHTDLYLSKEWLEQPHWWVQLDYDNRQGGYIQDILVDAVTGEVLQPSWGPH